MKLNKEALSFYSLFSVDLRSLALLRIFMSIAVITDCVLRLPDLVPFYTDVGIVPRTALFNPGSEWTLSIYNISGNSLYVLILFLINIVAGFLLAIGYRTRLISFICWFMMLSLVYRNPLVTSGSDVLFTLILFWGIFLPWGTKYSVDSIFRPTEKAPNTIVTIASVGYYIQIMCLYLFAGLYKLRPEWLFEGNGVYYALMYIPYRLPLGELLLNSPLLLRTFSLLTVAFELSVPILLIAPYRAGFIRTVTIAALIIMHISFGLTIELGMFSLFVIASISGLLPTWFWIKLQLILRNYFNAQEKITVYSDYRIKHKPLLLQLLLTFLILNKINLVSSSNDSPPASLRTRWLLIRGANKDLYSDYKGLKKLTNVSPLSFFTTRPLLFWMVNTCVRIIFQSKSLSKFFLIKTIQPSKITPPVKITKIFLSSLILYTIIINIIGIRKISTITPKFIYLPADLLGFNQRWSLFTPPMVASNLLLEQGVTSRNETIDLMGNYNTTQTGYYEFPSGAYPNHRWKKLAESILAGNVRKEYSDYLCRAWTRENPLNPLTEVYLIRRKILTGLNQSYIPAGDEKIYRYSCSKRECLEF